MKKTVLREYARLIVRSGVNVQKGQEVLIYARREYPNVAILSRSDYNDSKSRK